MSETLQRAITEIRSGDKKTGQRLLAEVIRNDPRNETAWLWMSSSVISPPLLPGTGAGHQPSKPDRLSGDLKH